eukprot:NODE_615_length_5377_cov_0.537514.p3 type:complete len:118 gc:universal NODE_615_length_5377_cov_0.537514:1172-819(-)
MSMKEIAPGMFEKITKNCCNSGFATCQSGFVADIYFPYIEIGYDYYYLNGTFGPLGLPPHLLTLKIDPSHTVYGNFPQIPVNMTQMTISNCFMSGDLPVFPPTLSVLSLNRVCLFDG